MVNYITSTSSALSCFESLAITSVSVDLRYGYVNAPAIFNSL